jgi:translation initiation factor IF-2
MLSIKLHEATKQFKISNKLAMFFLEKLNVPVKSHSSVISMDQLEMLREFSNEKDNKYPDIRAEFNRIEKEKKQKAKNAKNGKSDKDIKIEPKETPIEVVTPPKPIEMAKSAPTSPAPSPKQVETKPTPPKPPQAEPTRTEPSRREPSRTEPSRIEPSRMEPSRMEPPRQEKPRPESKQSEAQKLKTEKSKVQHKPEHKPKPHKAEGKEGHGKPQQKPHHPKSQPKHQQKPQQNTHPKKENTANKSPRTDSKEKSQRTPPSPTAGVPVTMPRSDPRTFNRGKNNKYNQRQKQKGRGNGQRYDRSASYTKPEPIKPKTVIFNLPEMIQTSHFITIKDLAEKLNVRLRDIEDKMRALGKEYNTNQLMDNDEIKEICLAFGVEVDIVSYEDDILFNHIEKHKDELSLRAPVVTVMGHVDHGKTTLLDTLRNSQVADREAGGITQKIGAYKLIYKGNDIIFIDTPGHEAFTNIRARGAKVTDIVILVVAANDGVKPQTIEAINHALAAEVPIIVAINKIDLPTASPDKVKQELTQHNIVVEDWGGDIVSVDISAKNNENLDSLLEMISLVSEMQEFKSYKNIPARGFIIESRLDPQLGPLGTVLLQQGHLKRGDSFICGSSIGKVKSLFDDQGKVLTDATAPVPVEIMGFDIVPEAGELFQITDNIESARKVAQSRTIRGKEALKEESQNDKKISLQSLFARLEEEKTQAFPIIMKTDNFSSVEVLEEILMKHDQKILKINIVHKGIGNITESDILLASTSGSIIVGFNVKAPQKLMALAKRENVEIKLYSVIYHLIEDIDKAIKGEMGPEYIENQIGMVEVLQIFKISKIGNIAGCIVKEGKVTNKSKIKVLRKNDLVFEGDIETLRRVKNDASEVNAGTECGIKVKNFNSIEVGDILEVYEITVKERT